MSQSTDTSSKNQRIAKNTILLYFRTLFTMLVSLYTSRIILQVLGVDNYGIYNVVGGTISMFSIFSGSLSGAISRFITFGLGKGDIDKLKTIFCTSVNIQVALSVLIGIAAEIGGLWMLNSNLNIPPERMYAAHWVLQFSILSFILGLISVPYNACIIAHEHMTVFAYIGILEVVLKLLFVAALYFIDADKLIIYALALFLISLLLRVIYGIYCKHHFPECQYQWMYDKQMLKEMTTYAFWGFFGNTAYMFNTQGVNILINVFFGVSLNAARGIVGQVEGAVMQFVNNFTTAVTPQITKSYAAGDKVYMFSLVCRGAKFSYLLLLFFLIPLFLEAESVLQLWLGTVPDYAPVFLKLSLFSSAIMLLGNTGYTAVMATGKIRNYQLVVTLVGCLVFPLTWVAFQMGSDPEWTYLIYIMIYFLLNWIRLVFMRRLLGFPILVYAQKVFMPIIIVTLLSFVVPYWIHYYLEMSFWRICLVSIASALSIITWSLLLALDRGERNMIREKSLAFIRRR